MWCAKTDVSESSNQPLLDLIWFLLLQPISWEPNILENIANDIGGNHRGNSNDSVKAMFGLIFATIWEIISKAM